MTSWPDRRILDLFGINLPILQAPMAGASTPEMAIAVGRAGGLAALAAAMLTPQQMAEAVAAIRAASSAPLNINFFCHTPPAQDPQQLAAWQARLAPYCAELGLDPAPHAPAGGRAPFDEAYCAQVEALRPEVVSFHFGLPEPALMARVQATGARIIASATTVAEAQFLASHGCDAIIAMGLEAGGHRGNFLTHDMNSQIGTFSLVPQIADAVSVPVIAAGGIADGRGVAAAFMLGASAVQVGTAYLFSPEASVKPWHRKALAEAASDATTLTNIFTGRPARGITNRIMRDIGPLSPDAPAFPLAGGALAPIRAKTEAAGSGDFSNMWSGQASRLAVALPAGELTRKLAEDGLKRLGAPSPELPRHVS
jgi:nitronate monooxygenase